MQSKARRRTSIANISCPNDERIACRQRGAKRDAWDTDPLAEFSAPVLDHCSHHRPVRRPRIAAGVGTQLRGGRPCDLLAGAAARFHHLPGVAADELRAAKGKHLTGDDEERDEAEGGVHSGSTLRTSQQGRQARVLTIDAAQWTAPTRSRFA